MLSEYNYQIRSASTANLPWNSNQYCILNNTSGSGTFSKDGSQTTLVYLCEYDYHEQFLDVVIGKTVISGGDMLRSASNPSFSSINGSLPEPHPRYYNFYAASADVQPMGVPGMDSIDDSPYWNKAKVTVVFRAPDYNIISDDDYEAPTTGSEINRFTTKITTSSTDLQTVNGAFKFVSSPDKLPLDFNPSFTVAQRHIQYIWRQIPVATRSDDQPDLGYPPNIDLIECLEGRLNSLTFDGNPPGTVLFANAEWKLIFPQTADEDAYYWDITYNMVLRNYGPTGGAGQPPSYVTGEYIGHNYAWNGYLSTPFWDLYTNDGTATGVPQYQYCDLNQLFVWGATCEDAGCDNS